MSTIATATVETLTAEVRALHVGQKQITLSVAKQLDRCSYEQLEPFGRVRTGRKDERDPDHESSIEVVGRHRQTGALVWAYGPALWPMAAPVAWDHWIVHHEASTGVRQRAYTVAIEGIHHVTWERPRNGTQGIQDSLHRDCPDNPHQRARNPHDWETDRAAHEQWETAHRWLTAEWAHHRQIGDHCDMAALRSAWEAAAHEELADRTAQAKLVAEIDALPLIVLAGLR